MMLPTIQIYQGPSSCRKGTTAATTRIALLTWLATAGVSSFPIVSRGHFDSSDCLCPPASSFDFRRSKPSWSSCYDDQVLRLSTDANGKRNNKNKSKSSLLSILCAEKTMENNDSYNRSTSLSSLSTLISLRFQSICAWCDRNFFLVGMVVAIALAKVMPEWGRNGGVLRPELYIGQYGVTLIFLLSGWSLPLSQLTQAATNTKLNILIQCMTFVVWPLVTAAFFALLQHPAIPTAFWSVLPRPLWDGLAITACLPTTVNMCVVLTAAAGGNVATALTNAVSSNLLGIVATPALVCRWVEYSGSTAATMSMWDMTRKLSAKVLLPVALGQLLRLWKPANEFYRKRAPFFKRTQEVILLSILWNAFCTAIASPIGLDLQPIGWLTFATLIPMIHVVSLLGFFTLFARLGLSRADVVAAMFCASHKTLAFGLPMIHTLFGSLSKSNPHLLASYCAPILLLHPVQLVVGSILIPRLQKYTKE